MSARTTQPENAGEERLGISILKTLWIREATGRWAISNARGLRLRPQAGFDPCFFKIESELELMTNNPRGNIHSAFATFGPTEFLLKQSVLPVVAWPRGEKAIRCIGTASVISCSGYLLTAAHVLLDPVEAGYGKVARDGNKLQFGDDVMMGAFLPLSPAYGVRGFRFLHFEECCVWGDWAESPLVHEEDRFHYLTDIAICKVPELPDGVAHQPLNLSVNAFRPAEKAYALGYALMDDIPAETRDGQIFIADFAQDVYVSVGDVMSVFPENHLRKDVPTPGPCFDFHARIPGKMSGGPILGADGAVVRGVVSRSFSGENHAFGAMLGPALNLPLSKGKTLKGLMDDGSEGIARVQGVGL